MGTELTIEDEDFILVSDQSSGLSANIRHVPVTAAQDYFGTGGGGGSSAAEDVSVTDAGNLYTATDVEGVLAELPSRYQPLDGDLTAIAALSTTAYGRALLALADLAALQAVVGPTGTPSASTYLRGDGSWSTPAGGSSDPLDGNNIIATRVFAR